MDWMALSTAAAEYFAEKELVRGLGPDDILHLSAENRHLYLGPIDWTWGYQDPDIAKKLESVKSLYESQCNQVEILINEAGALIERALGDVIRYDDLNVERFKVMTEFIEYTKVISVQAKEKADKIFWDGLAREADFSSQARGHANDGSSSVTTYYNNSANSYAQAREYAGRKSDFVSQTNAEGAHSSMLASQQQYAAQVAANNADKSSHASRRDYESAARNYQVQRQDITKDVVGLKLVEMLSPGGALNYNERMAEIGERALNDFLETFARLRAIALGLRDFFSIMEPSEAELDEDLKSARTRVEGAVKWLRKAANAIARVRMDEQECVVRLTILPQKKSLFEELLAGRNVAFTADLVASMDNPHLRGVSATAESLAGDSWIDLEVATPEQKLSYANITLSSVKTRLGRVSSSSSLNVRDITGIRPIVNRSPVGNWTILATRGDRGKAISRLHVDFHLAFRSS
ncbi:hypothetical protein RFN29_23980 [Mesorhizobium sp. VK22B]|uniref:Uncharacterized protein n=1 Tax=Mesorhizobium captivum TaxID=3072319 RepID=A0ABU4Z5S7_9HYPH|nr:hypothetical protein [Mesorhizobium sp. VK22B]MDX8494635.1 hypothetical protein [Mesorhizobium sp. VK22B]